MTKFESTFWRFFADQKVTERQNWGRVAPELASGVTDSTAPVDPLWATTLAITHNPARAVRGIRPIGRDALHNVTSVTGSDGLVAHLMSGSSPFHLSNHLRKPFKKPLKQVEV